MYQPVYTHPVSRQAEVNREYGRILSAAVISEQFRKLLLSNPSMALAVGFAGEKFHLNTEDRNRLTAIHATSLVDFAAQLNVAMKSPAPGYSSIAAD